MNKKILIGILILIMTLLIVFIFVNKEKNTDAIKFKKEYENLNDKTNDSSKKYSSLTIDKENSIVYADYDKIFEILDGTGVIYFGFPECPWCRTAVPILLEAAKEVGLEKIYYINNADSRDVKKLSNNEIITEKEASADYKRLLEKIGPNFISEYKGLNNENIKRLYFPTVIIVKDGTIIDFIEGTVDSQENPYIELTKKEKQELKNKYVDAMEKLFYCGEC